MKIPAYKYLDVVEIEWLDSVHSSGWHRENNPDWIVKDSDLEHKTIGYYLTQTAKSITVIQSHGTPDRDTGKRNVDAEMSIPIRAITKIRKK